MPLPLCRLRRRPQAPPEGSRLFGKVRVCEQILRREAQRIAVLACSGEDNRTIRMELRGYVLQCLPISLHRLQHEAPVRAQGLVRLLQCLSIALHSREHHVRILAELPLHGK